MTSKWTRTRTRQFRNQDFIVTVKASECVYVMNLNRENKGNKLSLSFMHSIAKHIDYYESIATLKGVVLRSFDQKLFSQGTDFKSIEVAILENRMEGVHEQLAGLQLFAEKVAAANLAMPTNINGHVCNSAASIFTQLPFVYGGNKLRLVFNEIDMQSPLLGGVSYTLSRLPDGIGAYLALTGRPIYGQGLKDLGFVKEFALLEYENLEHLKRRSPRNYDVEKYDDGFRHEFGHRLSKAVDIDLSIGEFFERSSSQNARNVLFDLYYRKQIIEHAGIQARRDLINPEQWLSSGDSADRIAGTNNYLIKYEFDVLQGLPELHVDPGITFTPEQKDVIAYAFCQNDVQGVLDRLASHPSDFAKELYEEISAKNPFILAVVLRQLRLAESMAFGECLKMEYATGMALAEHNDTSKWVFRKLSPENRMNLQGATFKQVREFAEKLVTPGTQYLDTPFARIPKAFLPAKKFYAIFPEPFRCYFHSQPLRRPDVNQGYQKVVKAALLTYGVDHHSPSFDKFTALDKMRLLFKWWEKNEARGRRLAEFMASPTAKQAYFQERLAEIDKFRNNSKEAEALIERVVEQVFQDELLTMENNLVGQFKQLQRVDNVADIERLKKVVIDRFCHTSTTTEEQKAEELEMILNLPLEIGPDRFTLSDKGRKLSHLDEISKAYQRELSIKNKTQLQQFYRRLLPPDQPLFSSRKLTDVDYHFLWDKNHIFSGAFERDDPTDKGNTHKTMYYLCRGLETPLMGHFRQAFFDLVNNYLIANDVDFTWEMRQEVHALINSDVIVNYKEYAFDLERLRELEKSTYITFMKCFRSETAKADLEKFLVEHEIVLTPKVMTAKDGKSPNPESARGPKKEIPTEAEIAKLKQNNEIHAREPAKNDENDPLVLDATQDSLIQIIFNEDVMPKGLVTRLKMVISCSKHPLVQDMVKNLLELYQTKFVELFQRDSVILGFPDDSSLMAKSFWEKAKEEMLNEISAFLLPHLMYNVSTRTLTKLEKTFDTLTQYLAKLQFPNVDENQKIIPSVPKARQNKPDMAVVMGILRNGGMQLSDNPDSVNTALKDMDLILNCMIELNHAFRDRLNMREDMMKRLGDDMRLALRLKFVYLANNSKMFTQHLKPEVLVGAVDSDRLPEDYENAVGFSVVKEAERQAMEEFFKRFEPKEEIESMDVEKLREELIKTAIPGYGEFLAQSRLEQKELEERKEARQKLEEFLKDKNNATPPDIPKMPPEVQEEYERFSKLQKEAAKNYLEKFKKKKREPNPEESGIQFPERVPLPHHIEKYFDSLKPREQHILGKLQSYTDHVRELMRTNTAPLEAVHAKTPDANMLVEGGTLFEGAAVYSRTGQVQEALRGKHVYKADMDAFIRSMVDPHSQLKPEFQKLRDAAQISYFSDMVHKIGELSMAMQAGVHATTIGTNQYGHESLRWTMIKRRLADGQEDEEHYMRLDTPAVLDSSNLLNIKRLESLSRGYFQGQKSGCFENIYYHLSDDNTETPDCFSELDQRQSAKEWLEFEVYRFCNDALRAERASRNNMLLDINATGLGPFFTGTFLAEHLRNKLYTELYTLERFGKSVEDAEKRGPIMAAHSFRQDPKLLDWKKVLENDLPVRKYLAYESFAHMSMVSKKVVVPRLADYARKMTEQMYDFDKEKTKPRPPLEPEKPKVFDNFQIERFYDEVVNSVSESKDPDSDALKKEFSDSLDLISKRLKFFR